MENSRPKVTDYLVRQDVLGLALDLHMLVTGVGPDLPDESRDHAISFLRGRLHGWVADTGKSELFDNAVRLLLTIAVREAEEHKSRWG